MDSKEEETFLTTRQAAERLGVNFRTIQNWVEKGVLRAWKTAGGHRRIASSSIDDFLRQRKNTLQGKPTPTQKKLKILIVEDEEALRGVYEAYFEGWNFPVELFLAANGVEGLLRVGQSKPDIIITDLLMPDMDGFAMLRTLSQDPNYQKIHFIAVTRLDDTEIAEHGGLPDLVITLKKPIAFDQLEFLIRAIIQEASIHPI